MMSIHILISQRSTQYIRMNLFGFAIWNCYVKDFQDKHTHTHPQPHRKHIFHTAECIAGTMQMFTNGSTHTIMRSLQNGDESWHFREF